MRYVGIFFGMLTLAFGMLFHSFLFKFYYVTGGDSGMRVARMNILVCLSTATTRSNFLPDRSTIIVLRCC